MPAATSSNAIPAYFVVMIDFGRKGREAVVDPEITRNGVIDRIRTGEYADILFIHHVQPGHLPEDVTADLIGEAEMMREAA